MRAARTALNRVLNAVVSDSSEQAQRFDRAFFRNMSRLGLSLGIADAEPLGEQWTLDLARILYESVLATPYGSPLNLSLPLVVSLELTNACRMRCKTCYADSVPNPADRVEMSTGLVSRLADTPVPAYVLTGGEPLDHGNCLQIVDCLLRKERKVTLATARFDRGLLDVAARYPRKLTVLYSFWGDCDGHDSIRGAGSFAASVSHLRRLSKHPVVCSINYVVPARRPSGGFFEGLERIVSEIPTLRRVYVTRSIGVGRIAPGGAKVLNGGDVWDDLCSLKDSIRKRIVWSLPEKPPGQSVRSRLKDCWLSLVGIRPFAGCGASRWVLHVDASGRISPCFAHRRAHIEVELLGIQNAWSAVRGKVTASGAPGACAAESEPGAQLLDIVKAANT